MRRAFFYVYSGHGLNNIYRQTKKGAVKMEIKYTPVNSADRIFCETKEQNIDCDMILPDYCPAVMKVLGCSVECCNDNTFISGDKLNVDAYASVRLLYIGEENKICTFRQEISFAKSAVYPEASEGDLLCVSHKNISISTRVTGQRKVEVHAVCAVCFELFRLLSYNFVSGADDDKLQCKTKKDMFFDVSAVFCENFDIREMCTEDFPSDKNIDIIRKDVFIVCNEYKTVKNKLMIKGICEVKIAYMTDGENISVSSNNIPFTNVFDVPGIRDGDDCNIALFFDSMRTVNREQNGSVSTEICVKARINAVVGKKCELELVSDAYSPSSKTELKSLQAGITEAIIPCDKIISTEVFADSYDDRITDIYDSWTEKLGFDSITDGNNIIVRGSVVFNALAVTEKGEKICMMRSASFEEVIENKSEGKNILVASLFKNAMNASIQSDGKILFRADFKLCGYIITGKSIEGISAVVRSEEYSEEDSNTSVITVYFADKDEDIWDIAKENCTTVALIKKYNDIDENTKNDRRILILPNSV